MFTQIPLSWASFVCLQVTVKDSNLNLVVTDEDLKGPLKVRKFAGTKQICPSKFQTNRLEIASHLVKPPPKRKTVYSEPCHVLRGEKCPDASRMFALKYRVRLDLNTDVGVFDWHARLRLAPRWRLAVAKGLRENCRDVGRGPPRKVHTVICHRSGQHYLKSAGPTYI